MSKTVFCICTTRDQIRQAVKALQSHGFACSEISVLLPGTVTGTLDLGNVNTTKAPEGTATGAVTGGLAGGVLGLLAGIGTLAIPGLGVFIAAGPILAALGGAAFGATAGGVVGGLIGLGFHEIEAKHYEQRLMSGNFLVSVHVEDGEQEDCAKKVFKAIRGEDIATSRMSAVTHPD